MVMPGRTRAQIRLKFNREEKINPAKITEHLIRKRKPVGKLTWKRNTENRTQFLTNFSSSYRLGKV